VRDAKLSYRCLSLPVATEAIGDWKNASRNVALLFSIDVASHFFPDPIETTVHANNVILLFAHLIEGFVRSTSIVKITDFACYTLLDSFDRSTRSITQLSSCKQTKIWKTMVLNEVCVDIVVDKQDRRLRHVDLAGNQTTPLLPDFLYKVRIIISRLT
jgi:hypothetical protein